jgi:hypothetical protein
VARRVLRVVGAAVGVVLTLGIVAGLALTDRWWPAPGAAAAPALEVGVAAIRTDLVCPGPPRLPTQEGDVAFDEQFDPAPAGSTTSVTGFAVGRAEEDAPAGGYTASLDGAARPTALAPRDAPISSLSVTDVDGPGLLHAEPGAGAAALLAGATLTRTDTGDLRGLAGARCQEPSSAAWLVAGSTEVGASTRLVLANPGDTPATVSLQAWGEVGPVDLGQAASVLVPARAERSVLVEAFAPDQPRLALRTTVDGGQVAAFVQDSALNGFVPVGVDLTGPAAEPATRVLVPGVVLTETDIDATEASLLRVVNPGDEPADVRLHLLDAEGETTIPGAESRVVEPGTVADISLAGVPAGSYTAELVSEQPVTAAVMLSRVGGPSADDPDQRVVDRAWVPAARPMTTALVPVPAGKGAPAAVVVVSNPGSQALDIRVRVVRGDGRAEEADVVSVAGRSTLVIEGDRLTGAVGVELVAVDADPAAGADERSEVAVGQEPAEGDAPAREAAATGLVAAAVLVADASDGPLVTAVSAQPDLETTRLVSIRLPHR